MEYIRKTCLFLLLALLLLAPVGSLWAAPAVDWDNRLTDIGVVLEPAVDCAGGCWRLIDAYLLNEQESGGLHHVFIKMLDEYGNQLAGQPWYVFWPDGNVRILSKPAPDWADFPLFDCFDPKKERGAYTAFAGDDPATSDWIVGMGLPVCLHYSFGLTWRWEHVHCADCSPRGYLPVAIR